MTPKTAQGAEIKNKLQKWPTLMNMLSMNFNNTWFCSELNEENAGKSNVATIYSWDICLNSWKNEDLAKI